MVVGRRRRKLRVCARPWRVPKARVPSASLVHSTIDTGLPDIWTAPPGASSPGLTDIWTMASGSGAPAPSLPARPSGSSRAVSAPPLTDIWTGVAALLSVSSLGRTRGCSSVVKGRLDRLGARGGFVEPPSFAAHAWLSDDGGGSCAIARLWRTSKARVPSESLASSGPSLLRPRGSGHPGFVPGWYPPLCLGFDVYVRVVLVVRSA